MIRRSFDLHTSLLGPRHPDTAWAMMWLGSPPGGEWGTTEERVDLCKAALSIFKEHDGYTYECAVCLGNTAIMVEDTSEQIRLMRESLDAYKESMGRCCSDIVLGSTYLAFWLTTRSDHGADREDCFEEASAALAEGKAVCAELDLPEGHHARNVLLETEAFLQRVRFVRRMEDEARRAAEGQDE